MKKNEYVSPEMEILEMTAQGCMLAVSGGVDEGGTEGGRNDGTVDRPTPP